MEKLRFTKSVALKSYTKYRALFRLIYLVFIEAWNWSCNFSKMLRFESNKNHVPLKNFCAAKWLKFLSTRQFLLKTKLGKILEEDEDYTHQKLHMRISMVEYQLHSRLPWNLKAFHPDFKVYLWNNSWWKTVKRCLVWIQRSWSETNHMDSGKKSFWRHLKSKDSLTMPN